MEQTASTAYELPPRTVFDVVATNDLTTMMTTVRGDNPFDVSPGMQLIRTKQQSNERPYTPNPILRTTETVVIAAAEVPEMRDGRENTVVHVAAGLGYREMLNVLVREVRCTVAEYNADGLYPLHLAAQCGHLACVQLLCQLGADPMALTRCGRGPSSDVSAGMRLRGRTSLFLAHLHGHTNVVEYLLPSFIRTLTICTRPFNPSMIEEAVRKPNVLLLALLFDAIDALTFTASSLPFPFHPSFLTLFRQYIPSLLSILLSRSPQLSDDDVFIFARAAQIGGVDSETELPAGVSLLRCILTSGKLNALQVLVDDGLVNASQLISHVPDPEHVDADSLRPLDLFLMEAKAHLMYLRAKRSYQLRGGSKRRRAALVDLRRQWRTLAQQLAELGISPFPCGSKVL